MSTINKRVWELYKGSHYKLSEIARMLNISVAETIEILDKRKGRQHD